MKTYQKEHIKSLEKLPSFKFFVGKVIAFLFPTLIFCGLITYLFDVPKFVNNLAVAFSILYLLYETFLVTPVFGFLLFSVILACTSKDKLNSDNEQKSRHLIALGGYFQHKAYIQRFWILFWKIAVFILMMALGYWWIAAGILCLCLFIIQQLCQTIMWNASKNYIEKLTPEMIESLEHNLHEYNTPESIESEHNLHEYNEKNPFSDN